MDFNGSAADTNCAASFEARALLIILGGILMKHLLLMAVVACLLSSGCQQALVGCKDCGQACHITRSQTASRPSISRMLGHGDGKALSERSLFGCGDGGEGYCDTIEQGYDEVCPPKICRQETYRPGPPIGQVAYPYYTVRGPRDFLQDNPPSIGPY